MRDSRMAWGKESTDGGEGKSDAKTPFESTEKI